MPHHRHPDPASVGRTRDAVEAPVTERTPVGQPHFPNRYDASVLAHAHDGVIATIRHVEVRPHVERRIAGPVGVARFDFHWSQIHRLVQRLRAKATYAHNPEDYAVISEIDGGDAVLE